MNSTIPDPEDRSAAADAARYRYLRAHFYMLSADMSGNHSWAMQYWPIRGLTPEHALAADMAKYNYADIDELRSKPDEN